MGYFPIKPCLVLSLLNSVLYRSKDQARFYLFVAQLYKISSKINYFDIALSLNIFKYSKINKNIHLCHLWITEACKDKYNKKANSKPMSHFVKIKLNEALNLKISKNKNVFKTKIITFLFLLIFRFKALFSFIPKCVIWWYFKHKFNSQTELKGMLQLHN